MPFADCRTACLVARRRFFALPFAFRHAPVAFASRHVLPCAGATATLVRGQPCYHLRHILRHMRRLQVAAGRARWQRCMQPFLPARTSSFSFVLRLRCLFVTDTPACHLRCVLPV